MESDQEDGMPLETTSVFANVIQEHLELRRRNSTLEHEMPLQKYMPDDPFENHPLFKTEEQARIEDTMDGAPPSIVDEPTSLDWPVTEDTFIDAPGTAPAAEAASEEVSDENLWTRSRDFDWGD
jgi:hypothetical protein